MTKPRYKIGLTTDAKEDLASYRTSEQKFILSRIKAQLLCAPLTETRNRKILRHKPPAPWELRIGRYRVFYHVLEDTPTISIIAVGHKEHNVLFVRGREVEL